MPVIKKYKWPSWLLSSLSLAKWGTALSILQGGNEGLSHMPAWPAFGPASPSAGCSLCPQAGRVTSPNSPHHGRRQDPNPTTALLLALFTPSPMLFEDRPSLKRFLVWLFFFFFFLWRNKVYLWILIAMELLWVRGDYADNLLHICIRLLQHYPVW